MMAEYSDGCGGDGDVESNDDEANDAHTHKI